MLIRFEGPDGGPEEHELAFGPNGLPRLHVAEVRHIQRVADLSVAELLERLSTFDGTAWTVLVQVLWKRDGRVVKFDDVDFDISTVMIEGDDVEVVDASAEADPLDPTTDSNGESTEAA